jgi:hypothetical protein
MQRIILIFGFIAGAIVSSMMFITMPMYDSGLLNFENGEIVGYTTMVIALSMVFVGIKSYRDSHLNGVISFGKAFKVGILITLIASVMYVISWEICYHTVASDFTDQYSAYYLENLKKGGATDGELQSAVTELDEFKKQYSNPMIRFGYTLVEIFPVGLIITLISAALLRRKKFLPAN